ncbi:MAG TPA: tRNA (adenosine(37)-N6)-dimethylallyltransferase MiaA [Dysgonamonadaceae bacterium]|nr:tRNA (adenosine(37)-N6)-dimethylallyltransferase MiaA [Dysgonamonadaceae bacterium]
MSHLITILGPTASGKTPFAIELARKIDGEIISGDSRQVYRHMDIGTGKDLKEYTVGKEEIAHHLIDIREPGEKYTLFNFQKDFHVAYKDILFRNKTPILCGGTGLYIESVLKGYELMNVPKNPKLRKSLQNKSLSELSSILSKYKTLHNTTDTENKRRAIRAIEIAVYQENEAPSQKTYDPIDSLIIGVSIDRDSRRQKISSRLKSRLEEGMIEEVKGLLSRGIAADDLIYYGLEYKFVTLHAIGKLSYKGMFTRLEIAIHQFAKRQMTWFRGMERRGLKINWIDAHLPMEQKLEKAMELLFKKQRIRNQRQETKE